MTTATATEITNLFFTPPVSTTATTNAVVDVYISIYYYIHTDPEEVRRVTEETIYVARSTFRNN